MYDPNESTTHFQIFTYILHGEYLPPIIVSLVSVSYCVLCQLGHKATIYYNLDKSLGLKLSSTNNKSEQIFD